MTLLVAGLKEKVGEVEPSAEKGFHYILWLLYTGDFVWIVI